METIAMKVLPRTSGKKYLKEARTQGLLPVNIYGGTLKGNITGSVDRAKMIKALHTPYGTNVLLTLETEKEKVLAITQHIDIDPVKNTVRHIDLLAISENEPVTVRIPLIKEGRSQGEVLGGRALLVLKEVAVRCLPAQIPQRLSVDVTPFAIGDRVMLKDLAYPDGVVPVSRENIPVIVINKGRGQTAEEATAEGADKPAEGAAAAAPKAAEGADKKAADKKK